jgi:hypothetical protein
VESSCEHGNKPSVSINGKECHNQLSVPSDCQGLHSMELFEHLGAGL